MEWIIFGFMGFLALLVAVIIGAGVYQANWGKGKGEANQGPQMSNHTDAPINPDDNMQM